jgi:hypothetical protein
LLLYALQIAHANLPGVDFHPPADADVLERDCEPIALPEEEKKEPKATCSPSPPPPALPQPVSSG